MPKCWIHGPIEETEEEKKSTKPLKEHPGWPDRKKEYQQNLAILFTPTKADRDWETLTNERSELEKKDKQKSKQISSLKIKANSLQKLEGELNDIYDTYSVNPRTISDIKSGIQLTIDKKNEYKKGLDEAEEEITKKDVRIKIQATKITKAVEILNNQKKKIEEQEKLLNVEKRSVGTQTDPYIDKHLTADIQKLELEKNDLDHQITELNQQAETDKLARDEEIQDLKQKIRVLTEVKMAREKSEDRLRKQSEEFEKVIKMNQEVYDILGQETNETGLLLRSQAVIRKNKEIKEKHDKFVDDIGRILSDAGASEPFEPSTPEEEVTIEWAKLAKDKLLRITLTNEENKVYNFASKLAEELIQFKNYSSFDIQFLETRIKELERKENPLNIIANVYAAKYVEEVYLFQKSILKFMKELLDSEREREREQKTKMIVGGANENKSLPGEEEKVETPERGRGRKRSESPLDFRNRNSSK